MRPRCASSAEDWRGPAQGGSAARHIVCGAAVGEAELSACETEAVPIGQPWETQGLPRELLTVRRQHSDTPTHMFLLCGSPGLEGHRVAVANSEGDGGCKRGERLPQWRRIVRATGCG